jgi:hypothetical protein
LGEGIGVKREHLAQQNVGHQRLLIALAYTNAL